MHLVGFHYKNNSLQLEESKLLGIAGIELLFLGCLSTVPIELLNIQYDTKHGNF